jgi:hypothetical protein
MIDNNSALKCCDKEPAVAGALTSRRTHCAAGKVYNADWAKKLMSSHWKCPTFAVAMSLKLRVCKWSASIHSILLHIEVTFVFAPMPAGILHLFVTAALAVSTHDGTIKILAMRSVFTGLVFAVRPYALTNVWTRWPLSGFSCKQSE